MCVEGLDDAEAELLRRIRKVIGPAVVVSASMDLHGNVSRELVHQTDLITNVREPYLEINYKDENLVLRRKILNSPPSFREGVEVELKFLKTLGVIRKE